MQYEGVERALVYVSEARERVEGAARVLAETEGAPHLIKALGAADRELLATHGRLMRTTYFGPEGERQLELGETAAL